MARNYSFGHHPVHTWYSCKSKPCDMLGEKEVKVYQGRFAFLKPKTGEKGDKYIDLHTVTKKQEEEVKITEPDEPKKSKSKKNKEEISEEAVKEIADSYDPYR